MERVTSNHSDELRATIEGWLRGDAGERYVDGVVRDFQRKFASLDSEVEDAVAAVIEKMLFRTQDREIRDPRGYFYAAVRNALVDATRRMTSGDLPEDDLFEGHRSPEEEMFGRELLAAVRDHIHGWSNKQMAVVTLAYIEAGWFGDRLEPEDVQEIVGDTLGVEITRTNVSTLWNRGKARLLERLPRL